MNTLVESLNLWGARFIEFAPVILWQSSLLMGMIFIFDFALQRKIRPAVRYALWFVVFIKLLVPPTLALPTGAAWWLRSREVVQQPARIMRVSHNQPAGHWVQQLSSAAPLLPQEPPTSSEAWLLLAALGFSGSLFAWAIFRWRQIARRVRKTATAPDALLQILESARQQAHVGKHVSLRLTQDAMSPAVCGLFRPVILLPQSLVERLTEKQLRAVLLHELIHLRRGDVWVNCAQTLLQIVYWWHPLLWFANARVRRLREESVDDAVMVALNEDAEIYAPTLLEVAKLAFNRPLAALGLVGILESRNALRYRIERLLNFSAPRRTGLSVVSIIGITAFTALAVPMGEPPARVAQSGSSEPAHAETSPIKKEVLIEAQFYQLGPDGLGQIKLHSESLHHAANSTPWCHLLSNDVKYVRAQFKKIGVPLISSPRIQTSDNVPASLFVGDGTNNIQLDCAPLLRENEVDLTTLARTTGKYAPDGKGWPDLGDKTNCAIYARMNIPSGDGVLLLAEHPGTASHDNLILILTAKIIDSTASHSQIIKPATNVTYELPGSNVIYELPGTNVVYQYDPYRPQSSSASNAPVNVAYTNVGRKKIYEKLSSITFDHIYYPGLTLDQVIENLKTETRERDPDHQGINFVLNRAKPQPTFDPRTGAPIEPPSPRESADLDLGKVKITLDPSLHKMRLVEVLEAIVRKSDSPIKYSLLNDGIEFSWKGPETPQLHTRTFKVDTNLFYEALLPTAPKTFSGGSGGATPRYNATASDVQMAVINFFNASGVNLFPPKSVFFNDQKGTLTVHATEDDLDSIEQAVSMLNPPPPQVTIKVRFVEVEAGNKGLNALMDGILTNAPSTSSNNPALCGILTQPIFKTVLQALEKRDHADLLNEGEVTTLSGMRANFQVVDVNPIVTGLTVTNHSTPEVGTAFATNGTIFDVSPFVGADGYTVQMAVTPLVTEFLGYVNSETSSKIDKYFKSANRSLPTFRIRTATLLATVWDGQTLVLGDLNDELVMNELGGKEFRRPFADTKKKRLFVFVTPTIIDAVGNRVHSKDYYDDPILR